MNEVLNTIYARRAVRKYKNKTVNRKIIDQIIDAGRMAPTAMNIQPWKFYVLTERSDINEFSKAIRLGAVKGIFKSGIKQIVKTIITAFHFPKGADFTKEEDMIFHGAPVVIFITSPKDNEFAALDIGMCAQNMMLAAKGMGLDTCPIGMAKYVEYTQVYKRLNIPANEHVNLAIILGYGAEQPELHERIKTNATYIEPAPKTAIKNAKHKVKAG
jgi:nitroreductase